MHHIWTYNFLEVVRQRILGVVGNGRPTYCFVGNLADFPAVKEFLKNLLRLGEISHRQFVTRAWLFLDT